MINEYQKRFIHPEKPLLSEEEHIRQELMMAYDPSYSDFMHTIAEEQANIKGPYPYIVNEEK